MGGQQRADLPGRAAHLVGRQQHPRPQLLGIDQPPAVQRAKRAERGRDLERADLRDANLCPAGYTASGTSCKGPGGATAAAVPTTFTGQNATITEPGSYFNSSEEDRLYGYSAEFDHPFGPVDSGDLLTAEYNTQKSETGSYQIGTYRVGCSSCSITVPPTSTQVFNTLLLRALANLGARTQLQFSNYFNTYDTHYSNNFGSTWKNQD